MASQGRDYHERPKREAGISHFSWYGLLHETQSEKESANPTTKIENTIEFRVGRNSISVVISLRCTNVEHSHSVTQSAVPQLVIACT